MARGRFYHDPARKHLEQYQDFSGGLNTMSSNDNTKDNELTQLENVDLGARGSLVRRKGYKSDVNIDADGKPQMINRFYRRYSPYNLLGEEGSFDGIKQVSGGRVRIGGWYTFNLDNPENAYKVPREESEDLIENGDFADGEKGWDLNVGDNDIGTSLMGKSTYAETGEHVFRLTMFERHSGWLNEYQKKSIPTKAGEKFEAEVRYRSSALSLGKEPYRIHIIASVHFHDGRPVERIYLRKYDVARKWKTMKHTFTMPSGAKEVYFGLGMLDNDMSQDISVYFEDFKVIKQPSKNIIHNGDFEKGEEGWHLNADTKEGLDSVVDKSVYAYGENVLRLTINQDSDLKINNEYQKQPEYEIPVKPYDVFEAEVMYHRAALNLGDVPYRSHIVASVHHKDGSITREYLGGYNASKKWRKIKGSFEMPKTAVKVVFGLGIYHPNHKKDRISVYFDNFKVKKREQVIVNGDFEQDEEGWHLNIEDKASGDSIVDKSNVAYYGENVMRIRRFKGHRGFYNEYQTYKNQFDVQEGDEVYAEARYRAGAKVLGVPPHRVHLIVSIKFKDGHHERKYIRKYDANYDWQKISGVFKMPKNAVKARLGVGLLDNTTEDDVAVYFDSVYARKQIEGSENSALAIRSDLEDNHIRRGLGYRFDGLEDNKYYLFAVDHKTDGVGTGALVVRDERYGVYPHDDGALMEKVFKDSPTEWTTRYMKFETYPGMGAARAYVYNQSPLDVLSTTYYDNARIYELTASEYHKIDNDPEYTYELIGNKYPYRTGELRNETNVETVVAIGGKFYIDGRETEVVNRDTIQSERIMESVSYGSSLYIASGSGLLEYNGSTITEVTPYIPDPLETLYIGSNGLIDNPYQINDEEQSTVELKQIQFSRRYGETNEPISIEVGVGKPSGVELEYKFERRNVRDKEDYWETILDWNKENSTTFTTNIAGEYQFKISVRKKGEKDTLDDYTIPKYIIKPTTSEDDYIIDASTMYLCNRIIAHKERLILYGDETKQDVIYISDLYNPAYFPVNNTLQFQNPRRERITTIKHFRDSLAVFTPSSIQALHGSSPEDYERYMLNSDVGCIADRSASVVQNHIVFLSYEGISLLKSVGTSESRFNVELIDDKVKDLVEFSTEAVSYVRDNQYHIVYPSSNKQLRYYYEWGVWTQDISDSLDFTDVLIEDGELYALGNNGRTIRNSDKYNDEGKIFDMVIGTKLYTFGESYSQKKSRELQIMFDEIVQETELEVDVFMDKLYEGLVQRFYEDFEHETEYIDEEQVWVTEIIPSHDNTIKKGYDFENSETVTDFAKRKNALIVLSGSDGSEGLQVKDSVVLRNKPEEQENGDILAIMEDGTIEIITGNHSLEGVKHTFHSGITLVSEGMKSAMPEEDSKRPRQAIGQKEDGSLVIITARGSEEERSQGITLSELSDKFIELNCIVAYNLGRQNNLVYYNEEFKDIYFDGTERKASDFLYFSKDIEEVEDKKKSGVISSETLAINKKETIYKVISPGKGYSLGTRIVHSEDKPLKIVGLGYIFKLKKP